MAIATYQARARLFVNAHIVESGETFDVPDTFVPPQRPGNNHADPAKVTLTNLAVKKS